MSHLAYELHVVEYLIGIFGMGCAELKVDNDGYVAIGHHSVGTIFLHFVGDGVGNEDGALVEERPALLKPLSDERRLHRLTYLLADCVGGEIVIVEYAFKF